jgi:hypothetical protein
MTQTSFAKGDTIVHTKRPEWGPGVVNDASLIDHEGQRAQRLIVKFANRGTVTLNTAIAELVQKDSTQTMATSSSITSSNSSSSTRKAETSTGSGGWLGSLTKTDPAKALYSLPDSMNDPFISTSKRLEIMLDSYRFSTDPRQPRLLLDWAIMQTGMADPLSKYSRQELEQAFPRFARDRDNLLLDTVKQLKREGRLDMLAAALKSAKVPAAREALQRALNR